jgi:superfamily I DNA/RNA helicase
MIRLFGECGVDLAHVLAVTFTIKTVREMKGRLELLLV